MRFSRNWLNELAPGLREKSGLDARLTMAGFAVEAVLGSADTGAADQVLDIDVTTGARFHTLGIVLSMGIKFAVIVLLGPPVAAVVIFEVLLNATSMFNHSNVRIPEKLDRVLRWVVVTPDMHRVHHSIEDDETNSNFGFNLPWWDRLFGTYRAQPRAGARAARHLAHVALDLLAGAVGLGFGVAPLEVGHHALVIGVVRTLAAVAVLEPDPHLADALAVEDGLAVLGRQRRERRVHVDAQLVGDGHDQPLEVALVAARPRGDGPALEAERGVGHDQRGVDLVAGAEPVAGLARAVRRVEREVAGCQPIEAQPAGQTGQVLGEHRRLGFGLLAGTRHGLDRRNAVGQPECRLDRVRQAPSDPLLGDQAVDDHLDGVLLVPGELRRVGEVHRLVVHARPGEALRRQIGQQLLVLSLAPPDDGCEHLEPGGLGELLDLIDDLLRRL